MTANTGGLERFAVGEVRRHLAHLVRRSAYLRKKDALLRVAEECLREIDRGVALNGACAWCPKSDGGLELGRQPKEAAPDWNSTERRSLLREESRVREKLGRTRRNVLDRRKVLEEWEDVLEGLDVVLSSCECDVGKRRSAAAPIAVVEDVGCKGPSCAAPSHEVWGRDRLLNKESAAVGRDQNDLAERERYPYWSVNLLELRGVLAARDSVLLERSECTKDARECKANGNVSLSGGLTDRANKVCCKRSALMREWRRMVGVWRRNIVGKERLASIAEDRRDRLSRLEAAGDVPTWRGSAWVRCLS